MKFFLHELSAMIGGDILGDPDLEIQGVSSFDHGKGNEITFAVDPKFLNQLKNTRAGAVIIPRDFTGFDLGDLSCSLVRSENPKLHFFRILGVFNPAKKSDQEFQPGQLSARTRFLEKMLSLTPMSPLAMMLSSETVFVLCRESL